MDGFWDNFGIVQKSLDNLLIEGEFNLEELLDILLKEEDLNQFLENPNIESKLQQFFSEKKNVEEIFNYVINCDNERYSSVCTEILVSKFFMEFYDESVLDSFFSFLKEKKQVDPMFLVYFDMIVCFMVRWQTEKMIRYFSKNEIMELIIAHTEKEELLKTITNICTSDVKSFEKFLFESEFFGNLILKIFDCENGEDTDSGSNDSLFPFLTNLFSFYKNLDSFFHSERILLIVSKFNEPLILFPLFQNFQKKVTREVLVNSIKLISEIVFLTKKSSLDSNTEVDDAPLVFKHCMEHLHFFREIMLDDKKNFQMKFPVFGEINLLISFLFCSLFLTNYQKLTKKMVEEKIFDDLFNCFFKYELNNFLHHKVQETLHSLFFSDDSLNVLDIFSESNLIPKLIENFEVNKLEEEKGNLRKSYIAFVNLITKDIIDVSKENDQIQAILDLKYSIVWKKHVISYQKSKLKEFSELFK